MTAGGREFQVAGAALRSWRIVCRCQCDWTAGLHRLIVRFIGHSSSV